MAQSSYSSKVDSAGDFWKVDAISGGRQPAGNVKQVDLGGTMANFDWKSGSAEQRLDRVFRAYGESTPIPEASVNFSANMWSAIEARRNTRVFGFVAKLVTSGALAASLLLGILSTAPPPTAEPEYLAVYINQPLTSASQGELLSTILESEDQR